MKQDFTFFAIGAALVILLMFAAFDYLLNRQDHQGD